MDAALTNLCGADLHECIISRTHEVDVRQGDVLDLVCNLVDFDVVPDIKGVAEEKEYRVLEQLQSTLCQKQPS